jgi:protein TonB
MLAVFILSAGLCYPFISGFYAGISGRYVHTDVNADLSHVLPAEKISPPPVPPAPINMEKHVFRVPEVVDGDVPDGANINQDDLGKITVNAPVSPDEPTATIDEPPVLDIKPDLEVHTIVEEMPTFVGGESARIKFLSENLVYPQMAKENNVQGTIYVSFVIDSKGHITNVRLLRGIGAGCDEEALRVISLMPDWNAGRQNGRSVNVSFNMPIVFKLAN